MPPTRSEQLRDLFAELLGLGKFERVRRLRDLEQRDPEIAAQLHELLRHDESPIELLRLPGDGPALPLGAADFALAVPERIGPYSVEAEIGRGGMGIVYRARQASPDRRVAIKVLRSGLLSDISLRRFEQEVQVMGLLDHPGIARIFSADTCDLGAGPQPYFVMDFVEGVDLGAAAGQATIAQRCELIARVADALQHAHERGIVHRDVKPENILVVRAAEAKELGQPKLLDFGIARASSEAANAALGVDATLTGHGAILGTLAYMSPEQLGAGVVSTASDVFSLGVVLYEVLAGCLPLDLRQSSLTEAIEMLQNREPPALRRLDRKLSPDLDVIARKAMAKDVNMRYASAGELAADLRRFVAREPIAARPVTTWYQLRRFAARNRPLATSLALLILLLVAGVIATLVFAEAFNQKAVAAQESAAAAEENAETARVNAAKARANAQRAKKNATEAAAHAARADLRGYAGKVMVASTQLRTDPHTARALLESTDPQFRGFEHDLLLAALDPAERLLRLSGPRTMAYTREGVAIVANARGRRVTVSEYATGLVRRSYDAPSQVGALYLSPSAARLALALESSDGAYRRLVVLSVASGRVLFDQKSPELVVGNLYFSPDERFLLRRLVGDGAPLLSVNVSERTWLQSEYAKTNALTCVLPGGRTFNCSGRAFDLRTLEDTGSMAPFQELVAAAPSGRFVAGTHGNHRLVSLRESMLGQEAHGLAAHRSRVSQLQWTESGSLLMSASQGAGSIHVADPHDGTVLTRHYLPWRAGSPPVMHPRGEAILVNTSRGIEELPARSSVRVLGPHSGYLMGVAFSPDGGLLATYDVGGRLTLWDPDDGERLSVSDPVWRFKDQPMQAEGVAFSSDGLWVHTLTTWRKPFRTQLGANAAERLGYTQLTPEPTSKIWPQLAPGSRLTRAWIKSFDGAWVSGPKDPKARSAPFHWADRRTRLVAQDGLARDWAEKMRSPTWHRTALALAKKRGPIAALAKGMQSALRSYDHCLAIDRQSRRLAVGERSGTVMIWSLESGELLQSIYAHVGPAMALAFTPDGRLLSGGLDGILCIWDPDSGNRLAMMHEHQRAIECLAMSPDGSRFATASADRTVRLWDTVPLWQRRADAAERRRLESVVAARVARELLVHDRATALAQIWRDASLSLAHRQAARRILLRQR